MNIKALIGAAALSALALSGAAFAQDNGASAPAAAPSGPGTMQPIPNPPPSHHARHMKGHHHRMKRHHAKARKTTKSAKTATATPPAK